MSERFTVSAEMTLLPFLETKLKGWSRSKVKARLKSGEVAVNDEAVTWHAHPLAPGDVVTIGAPRASKASDDRGPGGGLKVLFRDDALVAVDKPAGLLSVSSDKESERTALALVRKWLGRGERLWPVNRLDRETSGVLLFARSREAREAVQARWSEDTSKVYRAVVEGSPADDEGVIDQPLYEDKALNVHVGDGPDSKRARTRYRVLKRGKGRSLLEVELDTGRKHQIRAHLAWLGHPVLGDPRYGNVKAPRLGLHAMRLELTHPTTGERLVLEAEVPTAFSRLL